MNTQPGSSERPAKRSVEKTPDGKISLVGLDKAAVLAALFNASKPQGLGFIHYKGGEMTVEEARQLLSQTTYFDYVHGRVMKIDLKGDALSTWGYDRDNGAGAAELAIQSMLDSNNVNSAEIMSTHRQNTATSAKDMEAQLEVAQPTEMKQGDGFAVVELGLSEVSHVLKAAVSRAKGELSRQEIREKANRKMSPAEMLEAAKEFWAMLPTDGSDIAHSVVDTVRLLTKDQGGIAAIGLTEEQVRAMLLGEAQRLSQKLIPAAQKSMEAEDNWHASSCIKKVLEMVKLVNEALGEGQAPFTFEEITGMPEWKLYGIEIGMSDSQYRQEQALHLLEKYATDYVGQCNSEEYVKDDLFPTLMFLAGNAGMKLFEKLGCNEGDELASLQRSNQGSWKEMVQNLLQYIDDGTEIDYDIDRLKYAARVLRQPLHELIGCNENELQAWMEEKQSAARERRNLFNKKHILSTLKKNTATLLKGMESPFLENGEPLFLLNEIARCLNDGLLLDDFVDEMETDEQRQALAWVKRALSQPLRKDEEGNVTRTEICERDENGRLLATDVKARLFNLSMFAPTLASLPLMRECAQELALKANNRLYPEGYYLAVIMFFHKGQIPEFLEEIHPKEKKLLRAMLLGPIAAALFGDEFEQQIAEFDAKVNESVEKIKRKGSNE